MIRDTWDELGYGEILSDANRAAIRSRRAPVVDEAWVKVFPEDEGLMGETIVIHHIAGLSPKVPLPFTRHWDAHLPGGTQYNHGGPGSSVPFYPKK
jgi:filamentous hemagglutinin